MTAIVPPSADIDAQHEAVANWYRINPGTWLA